MEGIVLHHIGAPCVTTIRNFDTSLCQKDDLYYLNPLAIVRYEPGGAVITPPMFYSPFVYVDYDLTTLLKQKAFSGKNLPNDTLLLLKTNKIVLDSPPENTDYRESYIQMNGLPVRAFFEVTSACNCNCFACYHAADLDGYTPPLMDVLRRIDKLKELGIGFLDVTGGEPFLRNDLDKILNYIAGLKIHFCVSTNGEYLKEMSGSLLAALKKGLGLSISLDGVGQIHDELRQRKGLYDNMISGLDIVHSHKIPIYFIATMNRKNITCASEMISVAKRYDTTVHFRSTIWTGGAIINNIEHLDLARELKDIIGRQDAKNGFVSIPKIIPRAKYYGCGIRKKISVSSTGALFPCVMDRNRSYADIETYTQKSLIDELAAETSTMLSNHEKCRSCELNKGKSQPVCGGFCRFSRSYTKKVKM